MLQSDANFLKHSVPPPLSRGLRIGGRLDQKSRELDLKPLRARLREKPRTKAGQVRHAWPEIRALLEAGHSLKDIHVWLREIGIEIGYARLSDYTGKLKRRDEAAAEAQRSPYTNRPPAGTGSGEQDCTVPRSDPESGTAEREDDPLATVRDRERRQPGFQYNAEPDPKKLI